MIETNVYILFHIHKDLEELPLFLNSETLAKALGISPSSCYELMHEEGFPVIYIGKRMVVEKSKFIEWVGTHTKGGKR